MTKLAIAVFGAAVFLAGCEDPAANKPKATVTNSATPIANASASPAASPSSVAVKGDALTIDPENSKVLFVGSKVSGKHDGGFKKFTGTIDLVNEKPEESSVTVKIETASIFTDADGLTDHLMKPDFFDAETYPTATFTSTKIVPDAARGAGNYIVTGDLELRGQKKSITFPAEIKVEADAVAVTADFSINRKDFGMAYAGKADDLIRDDVVVKLELKTPRKK